MAGGHPRGGGAGVVTLWLISPAPPMVELRPWVRDEITLEWRPQAVRLLALSTNSARRLTPAGSKFVKGEGMEPNRTEWWVRPEAAERKAAA